MRRKIECPRCYRMNPSDANYCCYCSMTLKRNATSNIGSENCTESSKTSKAPVQIRPETRRYLYNDRGMTQKQYDYLVEIGAYVSVGDHSEWSQTIPIVSPRSVEMFLTRNPDQKKWVDEMIRTKEIVVKNAESKPESSDRRERKSREATTIESGDVIIAGKKIPPFPPKTYRGISQATKQNPSRLSVVDVSGLLQRHPAEQIQKAFDKGEFVWRDERS